MVLKWLLYKKESFGTQCHNNKSPWLKHARKLDAFISPTTTIYFVTEFHRFMTGLCAWKLFQLFTPALPCWGAWVAYIRYHSYCLIFLVDIIIGPSILFNCYIHLLPCTFSFDYWPKSVYSGRNQRINVAND